MARLIVKMAAMKVTAVRKNEFYQINYDYEKRFTTLQYSV